MRTKSSTGLTLTLAAAAFLLVQESGAGQNELHKLVPSDGQPDEVFGASCSIDGNLAVVGAYQDGDNGDNSGSAYVFEVSSGQLLHKLLASDGKADDEFGYAVSISGSLAIVGAWRDYVSGQNTGSAYVFDASSGQQLVKLLAADGASLDWFGISVSISGSLAIVGAALDDDNGLDSGSAYVFDTSTGQQLHKLLPADGSAHEFFGQSVSISGGLAIVGAKLDDDNGLDSGSAYVFDVSTGQQLHKLLPADGMADDRFGSSVFISGTRVLIGAKGDDDLGTDSGSAYVFDAITGQQLHKLLPSDGSALDAFGWSVSLSGTRAAVGTCCASSYTGAAYVFDVSSGQQIKKLLASDGVPQDYFGHDLSISEDLVLVGAFGDADNGDWSGSAYIFEADPVPGTPFCFCDAGNPAGTTAPCGNFNNGSDPHGAGCRHDDSAAGARLHALGNPSVTADTLVLHGLRGPISKWTLFFQANNNVDGSGLFLGDGLRCAGGGLIRLQTKKTDMSGNASSGPMVISSRSASFGHPIAAGETLYYQWWFRDVNGSPCGTESNTSNGYAITWGP